MTIAVLGASGQLGQSLLAALPPSYPDTVFLNRQQLDLGTLNSIQPKLAALSPDIVINASAYTAVDQAEQDKETAYAVNRDGVAELAAYCRNHDAALLHVSTDYVFDGTAHKPYTENHEANPSSYYGASKLAGELAIANSGCRHIILRTAWVFSQHGNNFLKTMLKLGETRDQLSVVADQVGSPTFAGDLAEALIATLAPIREGNCPWGLYHYAGDTAVSWYDFALVIFKQASARGLRVPSEVKPISTAEYPTPAPRPAWSVLDHSRFTDAFGLPGSNWRNGIATCLDVLKNASQ